MSLTERFGTDPVWCEEYGYGIGTPGGIFVLKYGPAGVLEFGERRQDFLHQLYWAPGGVLTARLGLGVRFVGEGEAFWAQRAVSHEVRATGGEVVYRVCLREVPPALDGLRAGVVSVDDEAGRLLRTIARPGCDETQGLLARARILAGLGSTVGELPGQHSAGAGLAATVARALAHDPGDDTRLDEWAARLNTSVTTLQRDFRREFGTSYSRYRARMRLQAARVLLASEPVGRVARRVGYASPSAFVAAFAKEFGRTPGGRRRR